jgi:hypothetical protein
MTIGKHARVVAVALAIGGAVLSLGTGQAEAKPRHPDDTGVRCSRWEGDHWEFYMPGDVITDDKGTKYVCDSEGGWHPVRTDDAGGRTSSGTGHLGNYGAP